MSFTVIVECEVCGTELRRSERAWPTAEDAQAVADSIPGVQVVLWAPRCKAKGLHSGPHGDINPTARLRVVECEPPKEEAT